MLRMRQIRLSYNAVLPSAKKSILAVLESGQFSPGPRVREFEREFARLHKAKHAVFVNSGTDALRISLLSLKEKYGWKDGDLVAVPAVTFVATVNVVLQAGLRPFFVDVNAHDFCLNPSNLLHRLQTAGSPINNLKAIIPVHLFGQACQNETYDLARDLSISVLEDSCETVLNPARGEVSCHSTYMAHHLTTGVGGMAVTNSEMLNLLLRSYANHGRNASYLPGYFVPKLGRNLLESRFRFDREGYSSRGTEFEAVLGLSQLGDLEKNVQARRRTFMLLKDALTEFGFARFAGVDANSCMMFPMVLNDDSKIDKYDLCLHLEKAGIETRDMMPITNQPCFKGVVREDDYPVAKNINKNGFYIPCHPGMDENDVKKIRRTFASYLKK